jgi:hypothetical protein
MRFPPIRVCTNPMEIKVLSVFSRERCRKHASLRIYFTFILFYIGGWVYLIEFIALPPQLLTLFCSFIWFEVSIHSQKFVRFLRAPTSRLMRSMPSAGDSSGCSWGPQIVVLLSCKAYQNHLHGFSCRNMSQINF